MRERYLSGRNFGISDERLFKDQIDVFEVHISEKH
jgi:hypothetical protein